MSKIHKLTEETVSAIAAGEVIERPAHVVKELIENALDAGADEIEISIVDAGLTKIEVIDSGEGMSKDDLLLSFLPHTTSKLSSVEDLHKIGSLGFRGEALSSICSVAQLSISSRTKSANKGTKVEVKKGKVKTTSIGMRPGTRVVVSGLFKEIPARKKFLKTPLTEMRLITDIVLAFVFGNLDVKFKLSHNNKTLIDETSNKFSDRVRSQWGDDFFTHSLPIKKQLDLLKFSGAIGKPQLGSSSSQKLWIYINNRKVEDKIILSAVKEAFGPLLMARSYPVGILFISVPKEFVDINVHPTKREVRFASPESVFQEIKDAILDLLTAHNLTYANTGIKSTAANIRDELKQIVSESSVSKIGYVHSNEVLQIQQSYLISETEKGLQIIDQHAAHESLLYFEFLDNWEKKKAKKKSQSTQQPIIFETSASDALAIEEDFEKIKSLGFKIEPFGKNTFRITRYPEFYSIHSEEDIARELLDSLGNLNKMSSKQHLWLATLACKSAIKAGQFLTDVQKKQIVSALTEKNYAYTCPHGRPVRIEITLTYLARMFKR